MFGPKSRPFPVIPPTEKAIRNLRALKLVEDRVLGNTHSELAVKYKMSIPNVRKELRYAISEGLVETLEERILNELVPLAIETYKVKMSEDRDAFVAKDVLSNLARLSEKKERKDNDTKFSLKAYLETRSNNDTTAKAVLTATGDIARHVLTQATENSETETDPPIDADIVDDQLAIPQDGCDKSEDA
jgi:hypothetical protein